MTRIFLVAIFLFLMIPLFAQQTDMFPTWDENSDGKVTQKEFKRWSRDMQKFQSIDLNKDGIITRAEYNQFMGLASSSEAESQAKITALQAENQALRAEIDKWKRDYNSITIQYQALQNEHAKCGKRPQRPIPSPNNANVGQGLNAPRATYEQNQLKAEAVAKLDAYRNLATGIRGTWVAACSKDVNGEAKIIVIGELEPTQLIGVKELKSQINTNTGMVTVPIEITRAQIINSIAKTNQKMTQDEYQELTFMFPDKVIAFGKASYLPGGHKEILAYHGAQLDARRRLVEQLRGVMIKSSTRMEDFVVTEHSVVASIENTLLIGVQITNEKVENSIAEVTIKITRPMFIYSMRRGLEANGMTLTPEEYQNLRNMLDQTEYEFTGKAAVQ